MRENIRKKQLVCLRTIYYNLMISERKRQEKSKNPKN
jgi:hypothetical protein